MFRIRRIYDTLTERNARAVSKVQEMLAERIPGLDSSSITGIIGQLHDPVSHGFRTILYVADDARGRVNGFALLSHAPDLKFSLLDYLVASSLMPGRGVGGALYERVREEALRLGCIGIFLECLPDTSDLCSDPATLEQNRRRLRFYERYGALPIVGTRYETPVNEGADCPPYLVFDDLEQGKPLRRSAARRIARAILERKYADLCPAEYVDMVVSSFSDDPVRLRDSSPRTRDHEKPQEKKPAVNAAASASSAGDGTRQDRRIALIVNNSHRIHHIRERGYVESPVRISAILRKLDAVHDFRRIPIHHFSDSIIRRIHDPQLISILRQSLRMPPDADPVYPYVFPVRHPDRPPADYTVRAGYYCIDTFTPLNRYVWPAARMAVDCALTGAALLGGGSARLAYALVRPPGHHAERSVFGGFCYLNSTAAAAEYLSESGHVAILDVDFHHGNGQQDIFYDRPDVLTVSVHGHPRLSYPYFAGFEDEKGRGAGEGYNVNLPIVKSVDGAGYRPVLRRALSIIREFAPDFLVVALGLDTAKGDPTGNFLLSGEDFRENGTLIGGLRLPTLVVQEGGYDTQVIGTNAQLFFTGLATANSRRLPV
jgi:acetoin utilization deacetylase AcuC-like enzyme/GNAT superfamily N-acetyltransferase